MTVRIAGAVCVLAALLLAWLSPPERLAAHVATPIAGFFGPPLRNHDHSSAAAGGQTLQNTILNSPTINNGTFLGPTVLTTPTLTNYTQATLPAAGTSGRVAYVTDGRKGLYLDNGSSWQYQGPAVHAQDYAGADIGAKINAAFTACKVTTAANGAPNGCLVLVDHVGSQSFATQINIPQGGILKGVCEECTVLTYTGSGTSILADGNPTGYRWNGQTVDFTLTTSSGAIGIQLKDLYEFHPSRVRVTGFSTAGMNLTCSAGLYALSIYLDHVTLEENTGDGLRADGCNAGINAISIQGSRIRNNGGYGINAPVDVRGWDLGGNNFEGNTAGALNLPWVVGLHAHGNYIEQAGSNPLVRIVPGVSQTPNSIVFTGNVIACTGSGQTAFLLGTSGLTYGVRDVRIEQNFSGSGCDYFIDPQDVRGGVFGPNSLGVSGSTTHVKAPGANSLGIWEYTVTTAGNMGARFYGGSGSINPILRLDGILSMNTAITSGMTQGDMALANAKCLRRINAAGTTAGGLLCSTAANAAVLGDTPGEALVSGKMFVLYTGVIANNATYDLTANLPTVHGQMVFDRDDGNGVCTYYMRGGLNSTTELLDSNTNCSPTAGTASSTNIYYSAGYKIENKTGGSVGYAIQGVGF